MRRTTLLGAGLATVLAAVSLATLAPAQADRADRADRGGHGPGTRETVRFSTFNASLNRATAGGLAADLSTPGADTGPVRQAHHVAETIQRTRPDVLLVNEFDFDPEAVDLFRDNFLEVGHGDARPIAYPYAYVAPSNTGVPSGHDLNNDGSVGGGDDAFGFGLFPGQYGMVVYSRYPIDADAVRTFQTFRWADMPGALLPDDPATDAPADWYSPEELEDVRLSSKSHWDVPIEIGDETVHFLVSHPTPPTFDGPEDRNGLRNHDEIRFWADYVAPSRKRSAYVYDDEGRYGGLAKGASFVIAGDQNADPADGDSVDSAIDQLLRHPRVRDPRPTSAGGAEAVDQGGANLGHAGDPALDTADFADGAPGNLRVDYVLPSKGTKVVGSGIFWPVDADPLYRLTGDYDPSRWPFTGVPTSDHRQVWVDLRH
jgi:hypothetical protein